MVEGVIGAPAEAPKKPALLKGGMVICWIYAATLALFLAILPELDTMGGVNGTVTTRLPGFPVTETEFTADILTASRVFVIPLLILSIITAYGLAKNRRWSRPVMMFLLILGIVLVPPQLANPMGYAISTVLAVFGWWYLYRKANVVAYYDAIKLQTTN